MKNEKIIRLLLEMLELDSSEYVRLMVSLSEDTKYYTFNVFQGFEVKLLNGYYKMSQMMLIVIMALTKHRLSLKVQRSTWTVVCKRNRISHDFEAQVY